MANYSCKSFPLRPVR